MERRNLTIEQQVDGKLAVRDIEDPLDLWLATRRYFSDRREVKTGVRNAKYPETTHGEVRQLTELWTQVHNQIWRSDLFGAKQHRNDWRAARAKVDVATAGADPTAIFPHNEDFWLQWTWRQAIYLSAVRDMPSQWDMLVESVKEAVQALPENLGKGAEAVADATISITTKAGEVAAAPVRGIASRLFGDLGKPLLACAAIVGGIVVVPRLVAGRSPVDRGGS